LVEHCNNTFSDATNVTQRLMHRRHDVDAIFAANDEIAFAVVQTLKELNYGVGTDVLVVGFDNTNRAIQTYPLLTTIGQDYEKIGEYLVSGLLQKLKGQKVNSKKVTPKLIIRDSA
jgi:LacI family transcriptional regulator